MRIFLRSSRSAHTPAGSARTANGRNCAALTIATSPTLPPIDSTANGSTIMMTRSPRTDSTWPANSRRYCGSSRSTAGIGSRRRRLAVGSVTAGSLPDPRPSCSPITQFPPAQLTAFGRPSVAAAGVCAYCGNGSPREAAHFSADDERVGCVTVMPGRRVTLVLCTRDGAVLGSVPPFDVPVPWWQEVNDVVSAARDVHGLDVVLLRLLTTNGPASSGGDVTFLAEVAAPPAFALAPWTDPTTADDHPLRQSWARPGGPAADLAWADAALARRGTPRIGPGVQMRTWNLSSLWRLRTASGVAWLKVVPSFFAHEGADAVATRPGSVAVADRARWSAGAARCRAGRGSVRRRAAAARADGGHAGQASGRVDGSHRRAAGARCRRLAVHGTRGPGSRHGRAFRAGPRRGGRAPAGVLGRRAATTLRRHRRMRCAGDVGAR